MRSSRDPRAHKIGLNVGFGWDYKHNGNHLTMTKQRLLIRADGSRMAGGIGIGHLTRCLALARSWLARGGEAQLLALDLPGDAEEAYLAAGATVERPPSTTGSGTRRDAEITRAVLKRSGASWLVLDGYRFNGEYQNLLVGSTRVLVIDDHGQADRYEAQIILDQNPSTHPAEYAQRSKDSILLLGPRFALVAPEFRSVARRRRPGPARRVAIMLGGAPSERMVEIVAAVGSELASCGMEVIAVGGAPRSDAGFEWLSSVPSVAEIMREADMCIAAAGVTTWECCCAGLPALLLAAAPNQDAVAEAAAAAGAAINLGRANEIDSRVVVARAQELAIDVAALRAMSEAGRFLVDGAGAERVVDEMLAELSHTKPQRQIGRKRYRLDERMD